VTRNRPWKEVVGDLVRHFEEHGDAISMVHPVAIEHAQTLVPVNTCLDPLHLEKIQAKPVRRWLWKNRKSRALNRPGGFLWASPPSDGGAGVLVGYGSLSSPDAADRYTRKES